jgi:hypothetical protein
VPSDTTRSPKEDTTILADSYNDLNPPEIQRRIQALTTQLLTLTTAKGGARIRPPPRAHRLVSQRPLLRAHLDVSHQGSK